MKELLQHKLVFVGGKGGVGKSTVSLAVARAAAKLGKKTLHISASQQAFVSRIYQRQKPIGYEFEGLEPKLWASTLSWKKSLHEYIIRQVHFEFLYRYVFDNRVINYFLEATPGLEDLLFLGKIMDTIGAGGKKSFDFVVVDLPATGHSLNMLKIPRTVESMIPTGPLHRHASRMRSLIEDRDLTAVCIVTLAEEMPVNETMEMIQACQETMDLTPNLVIFNGVYKDVFQDAELEALDLQSNPTLKKMVECGWSYYRRSQRHHQQEERLQAFLAVRKQPIALRTLPFVFDQQFSLPSIETLTQLLLEHGN